MTAVTDIGLGAQTGRRLLLWTGAGLAALGAHAGLVAWALRQPPVVPDGATAPTAVMIELAPEPVAPDAVDEEITPDTEDAPLVESAPPEALPPPDTPPAPTLPQPTAPSVAPPVAEVPSPAEAVPLPPVAEVPPPQAEVPPPPTTPPEATAAVAAPRPMARPDNLPKPEPVEPQQVEREAAPEPPSQARTRAQVQAPPAENAAASQTSRGSTGAVSPARWQSRLVAHLERRKRYPSAARQRREEGVAYVRFSIDGEGNVLRVALARSSGYPELDEEVLAMVRRASPVPAPPPGVPHDITAPVQFRIR